MRTLSATEVPSLSESKNTKQVAASLARARITDGMFDTGGGWFESNRRHQIIGHPSATGAMQPCRQRGVGSILTVSTKIPKTNRYRLVFFRLYPPALARIPGITSRAPPLRTLQPPLRTLHFHLRPRLSVLRSLWGSRERARGYFLYWRRRGFRGGELWLQIARQGRPDN